MTNVANRRNTRQRQLVLNAVRSRCDHPTADQIYSDIYATNPHVSRATVYRNLHLLAEEGSILAVKAPDAERFDLRTDDHAHLVCSACGAVVDIGIPYPLDEGFETQVSSDTGYTVTRHYTVLEGICPNCQAL